VTLVRATAASFVRAACSYDAQAEGRADFLTTVSALSTPELVDALRTSGRAQLPWRSMERRHETQDVMVTGVTITDQFSDGVQATATSMVDTRSSLGQSMSFEDFQVWLVPTDEGWLVAQASGGCL